MSLMHIKHTEKKNRNSKKCPWTQGGCKDNKKGLCCRDCKVYEFCDKACLNTPDRCRKQAKEMTINDVALIIAIAVVMFALMIVFEGDQMKMAGRALKGAECNGIRKNHNNNSNSITLCMCLE